MFAHTVAVSACHQGLVPRLYDKGHKDMPPKPADIKRFFSPIIALIALAILALGIVVSVACVNGIMNGDRSSTKGCILGGVLVLGGIAAFFGGAFKKGCAACRKSFTLVSAEFPPKYYEQIEGIVNSGDPAAVRSLVNGERTRANHRACLEVAHCGNCRRVGQLRVIEMNYNGQYDHFERGTKALAVSPEVVEAALSVVNGREPPPKR